MADKTNLFSIAVQAAGASQYRNVVVAALNDHVLRLSVMTEPYGLHSHPDSDEIFVGIDRTALVEFEDSSVELGPADLVTVPKGVIHKTRPLGDRSVNLKIEPANLETRWVEI
ncbi:hypothetical protein MesoLj113c_26680 [Mesorhizobium sp. 113-3-9]|uniref:hypothetical protein n=1 Tax=Mesorhizobium sp. 113-3-9 TaxID=2744517 RepID=UPI00192709BB|nr:hypothetical protein [Mesorhizobium sp. 113-3-9]BCG86558.1 hypothetical protein MesoLj113c_26680 [Mesorhizobium sp. 113-3-9]